jgi:hypothetical protein
MAGFIRVYPGHPDQEALWRDARVKGERSDAVLPNGYARA